jgi:beta-barrel assembly-enhancing protease
MKKIRLLLGMASLTGALSLASAFDLDNIDVNKAFSGTQKLVKGAFKMSDKDETALGHETASYLCARYGLVKNAALTRYVNLVGRTVANRSERTNIPYRFGILNTDEVNAYAAPGGYIFITKGLLQFVADEAELAGALAHEVGHVAKRHIAREIQKGNLLQGGVELASARKDAPEALKAANDFTVGLLFKGFSRTDEEESDRLGIGYASAAGYDAAGLERVLERMASGKKGENTFLAFDKSHPPAKDRLKVVQQELKRLSADAEKPRNVERFQKQTAALAQP